VADAETEGGRQARDGACTAPFDVQVQYAPPEKIESVADDRDTIGDGDRSILIIEDDCEFAKILLSQCRAKGFKGLVSSSGEQGLDLAETYLPDAVLLDIRLPGMSGCTVLNTLKKNHATRHIPVHIISVEETALPTMQSGAVGFTTKPVNRRELEEAFENIEQFVSKKIKDLLIVEDNDAQRLAIAKLIGDTDIHIVEAHNGADALAALKERSIDCMILDLGLPDMSGFELLNRMGEEKSLTMPPVIVYTGKDLTREDELALRKHAESIIIKGVKSADRLLDEVSLFLHKTVSTMAPNKREMIIHLHERDAMLSDKTILLVDDDMRNLFAMSKILSEKGMNVLKAEDGEKALALLDAHPEIALVLLDIMMPVMDGYQTARQIRSQPRFHDLPIIALTAKALKDDRDKCIEAGANDYLAKPVDVDRLFSTLRVWLYRRTCVL
jgi:CheY-like chemotaxis protein